MLEPIRRRRARAPGRGPEAPTWSSCAAALCALRRRCRGGPGPPPARLAGHVDDEQADLRAILQRRTSRRTRKRAADRGARSLATGMQSRPRASQVAKRVRARRAPAEHELSARRACTRSVGRGLNRRAGAATPPRTRRSVWSSPIGSRDPRLAALCRVAARPALLHRRDVGSGLGTSCARARLAAWRRRSGRHARTC